MDDPLTITPADFFIIRKAKKQGKIKEYKIKTTYLYLQKKNVKFF